MPSRAIVGTCLAFTLVVAVTGFAPAAAAGREGAAIHDPNPGFENVLYAVDGSSAQDVWAVGSTRDTGPAETFIVHWDGGAWSRVPSPNPEPTNANYLQAVSVDGASDAWAVGFSQTPGAFRPLAAHWDGDRWRQVAVPNIGKESWLSSVTALAPDDVWAIGVTFDPGLQLLLLHWDGFGWTQSPPPGFRPSNYVGCQAYVDGSDTSLWVAGDKLLPGQRRATMSLRWSGSEWTQVGMPDPGQDPCISAVAVLGPDDVWAVGNTVRASGQARTLTMHWDGTGWRPVHSPSPDRWTFATLSGVDGSAADDVWAVGEYGDPFRLISIRWNGAEWQRVPVRTPARADGAFLADVFALSPTEAWAVGNYSPDGTGGARVILLHWDGTHWSRT